MNYRLYFGEKSKADFQQDGYNLFPFVWLWSEREIQNFKAVANILVAEFTNEAGKSFKKTA
jgi:hypothetical protein